MYAGKTLLAQVMDFLPWTTFERIVYRYRGDHRRVQRRTRLQVGESPTEAKRLKLRSVGGTVA